MAISRVFCTDLPAILWRQWPGPPAVDDAVAVFRFQLPEQPFILPTLVSLLQPDEINRAERYHRIDDRQRFIYARGLLRVLTGRYTRQAPDQVRFTKDANNKPALLGTTGWQINVSHSGSWILLAVGKVKLGVDVEQMQSAFSFDDILPASFSQEEQAYVRAGADSRRRFYELWTRKEALVKATGKGMDDSFSRIPVLNGLHQTESHIIGGHGDWQVTGFAISADYLGAVAYQATVETPKFYTLKSGLLVDL
ncbi:hypothetical protein GCM10028819_34790 [Spirosoma humi]